LKTMLEATVDTGGVIVRTVGEGMTENELSGDVEYLHKMWEEVQEQYKTTQTIGQIHSEVEYSLRVLRDMLNPDVDAVWVEGDQTFQKILKFVRQFMPLYENRLHHYYEKEP